ncbi:hypothetical protein [Clostridium perfringens]|nr:hypothetical protein [Clostridium perfringens]EDS79599.1 hypothetical protein CPC_A0355 [Clostridium perfringens C str. JGS1495]MBI6030265.1 hypothetical protein [Clostridium perfringens]MBI6033507.1 hypothetical protein [Clostridium perfringens]NGT46987.1 hypothetical protein [Clostridium perfringens]NGT77103.1 hypothetical protein [Clostridium perfringens]
MNNEIIKKVNEGIIKTNINLTYKEFIDLLAEIQKKDNEIEYLRNTIEDMMEEESEEFEEDDLLDELEDEYWDELQEESDRLRKELKEVKKVSEIRYNLLLKAVEEIEEKDKLIKKLKEENRKNSGKINANWIKAGSKACSEALKFEESMDKLREFLETDIEKCDNGYITDYPNFQELIDKERLKDLESKKVEDLTLNDCIEECLIRLDLGQDKHKGKLFEIDLTRYFHLLYCHRREQNYVTDSIMDEGYDEVLLNIEPVGIIGYGLKHKVTLKVKIPE